MTGSRGHFEVVKLTRRPWLVAGAFLLPILIALAVAGVLTWEYTNSVSFCTNACHDVHFEEPGAHAASPHAQVKCTECHMGRVPVLKAVLLKTTHARHLPAVLFDNYERPLASESMRPAAESCERCHSAESWHDASAREIHRYLPNSVNTELRTYLLLETGTGSTQPGGGDGIHWHVGNRVEYIAVDEQRQDIRWVRVTLPDGQTVEYNDALNPLTPQEIAAAEKRVMDCVDCHNRIGHPFPSPEALVDRALAQGDLDIDLPYARLEVAALLGAPYPNQAAALAAADALPARYQSLHPGVATAYAAEIEAAVQVARDLVPQAIFETPGVSWQSFTENVGHRDDAGCFRCHDAKHLNAEGKAIRLQCTLCHGVPVTAGPGEQPPQVAIGELSQPDSHAASHFVSDHRILAGDTCTDCHGEVVYGTDDSSFCANSACHSRSWPVVDLDALGTHPVRLEGGHAEATCDACHKGSRRVAYGCATCHDAPGLVHYGPACEDCHTAAGFALARADEFTHSMPLEGRHADLGCASCHGARGILADDCASCHTPPPAHLAGTCEGCHTASGWAESTLHSVARGDPISHAMASGDECATCHDPAADWPAPADHAPYVAEQC
ncbi:MAG TPA: hypothetical protein VLC95_19045, partial [Anaerolineae bacterium]|nr:hypothetical protein [Anaerolineae bacterium]